MPPYSTAMPRSTFTFRSFDAAGEPLLTFPVSERLLPSQTHALPVLAAIERRLSSGGPSWRMCLTVEGTARFDIEFSVVVKEAAIVRIHRDEIDSLLILLADGAGSVDLPTLRAIQRALAEIADPACLKGVFDWATGTPPPLAAMIHVNGPSKNGMDMLGMCTADMFFRQYLECL